MFKCFISFVRRNRMLPTEARIGAPENQFLSGETECFPSLHNVIGPTTQAGDPVVSIRFYREKIDLPRFFQPKT